MPWFLVFFILSFVSAADERRLTTEDFEALFPELVRRCESMAWARSQKSVNGFEELRDAGIDRAVDAFLRGFVVRGTGSLRANGLSFLLGCAKRGMNNVHRKNRYQQKKLGAQVQERTGVEDSAGFHLSEFPDPLAQSPGQNAEIEEFAQTLGTYLGELSSDRRQVIELKMKGLSGNEIAARMGRSRRSVEQMLFRTRVDLSERLLDSSIGPDCEGVIARWLRK